MGENLSDLPHGLAADLGEHGHARAYAVGVGRRAAFQPHAEPVWRVGEIVPVDDARLVAAVESGADGQLQIAVAVQVEGGGACAVGRRRVEAGDHRLREGAGLVEEEPERREPADGEEVEVAVQVDVVPARADHVVVEVWRLAGRGLGQESLSIVDVQAGRRPSGRHEQVEVAVGVHIAPRAGRGCNGIALLGAAHPRDERAVVVPVHHVRRPDAVDDERVEVAVEVGVRPAGLVR